MKSLEENRKNTIDWNHSCKRHEKIGLELKNDLAKDYKGRINDSSGAISANSVQFMKHAGTEGRTDEIEYNKETEGQNGRKENISVDNRHEIIKLCHEPAFGVVTFSDQANRVTSLETCQVQNILSRVIPKLTVMRSGAKRLWH